MQPSQNVNNENLQARRSPPTNTFAGKQFQEQAKKPSLPYQQNNPPQTKTSKGLNNLVTNSKYYDVLVNEKDERFCYLLKNGTLKKIENQGNIIFSELPQIPGIWVCYRRPADRDQNQEKVNLDQLGLNHVPLLEGEEKLKILTYQHNKIQKLENLVSLPSLLYLDLYDNMIKEIENLNQLTQLRVLLLPKNQIVKLKNLECLTKLEVLDLHSNKIAKMEGLNKLSNLRILNLANNLITKIECIESLTNLVELNLKINLLEQLDSLQILQKLEKFFVSSNKLQNLESLIVLKQLSCLQECNFEENPFQKQKIEYYKCILAATKTAQLIDHKQRQQISLEIEQDELKKLEEKKKTDQKKIKQNVSPQQNAQEFRKSFQEESEKQPDSGNVFISNSDLKEDDNMAPERVIQIIGEQWKSELNRIKDIEHNNKKDLFTNSCVEGGHAEIEDETILFIYGNAFEIVLGNQEFQAYVEKIQFQYILFEFIIENSTLNILKNFKKLKELVFKDNNITSLLQLAKLEILTQLKCLVIENNPLSNCSFLKSFVVYRFPQIAKFNGKEINANDKTKSKALFQNFDKILQLPEKFYCQDNVRIYKSEETQTADQKRDKLYMKVFSKSINETVDNFIVSIIPSGKEKFHKKQQMEQLYEQYVLKLISEIIQQKNFV